MIPGYPAALAYLENDEPASAKAAAFSMRTPAQVVTDVLVANLIDAPFAPDSPFIIYSVTKTYLAVAALRLVERGVLALDCPIDRWLPTVPHASEMTLRHLLRHASGLPDYGGLPDYHAAVRRGDAPWSEEEYLARTRADQLLFPPGQGWQYSNIGYMVVRRLLETVCRAPLAEIIQAEICHPLSLSATRVLTSDAELADLVFAPSIELGSVEQPVSVADHYSLGWIAHGAIASTVAETAMFFEALFANKLLSPALLREMCTSTPLPVMPDRPFRRPGYGMGLQIDSGWGSMVAYGHSGGGPGARICALHGDDSARPVTVVVATPGEDVAQTERIAMSLLVGHGVS